MIGQLQIKLSGPYSSSFSTHSYCYELSKELKSVLKLLDFRYGPYSRTASLFVSQEPARSPPRTSWCQRLGLVSARWHFFAGGGSEYDPRRRKESDRRIQ